MTAELQVFLERKRAGKWRRVNPERAVTLMQHWLESVSPLARAVLASWATAGECVLVLVSTESLACHVERLPHSIIGAPCNPGTLVGALLVEETSEIVNLGLPTHSLASRTWGAA